MSEISNARQRLIDAVKEYAAEHYNEGGWDVLVETYSDEDIFNATRQCRTANGAIKVLAADLGVVEAVRQDVIAAGDDHDMTTDPTYSDWASTYAAEIASSGKRTHKCMICKTVKVPVNVPNCHLCY